MVKTWLKFVVWTMVISTITYFIIATITGEPFFGPTRLGGIRYLLFMYAMIISGIVVGSIIFGIWYIVVGRKKKKVSSSAPK